MVIFRRIIIVLVFLIISTDNIYPIGVKYVIDYIPIPGECGKMARIQPNTRSVKVISDVPAYTWSFGCSPTVGAMLAGYYDRHGYPNIWIPEPPNPPHYTRYHEYFAPFTNAQWTADWANSSMSTHSICPISASENGVLNRTIRGGVDDYWHHSGQANDIDDPCELNRWQEHNYNSDDGRCVADFMGTSQHRFGNPDGATQGRIDVNGLLIQHGTNPLGQSYQCHYGNLGIADFIESAGYTIEDCFHQVKNEYTFLKENYTIEYGGFSYTNFKAEIDANRPVMLQLDALNNSIHTNHEVLAIGYNQFKILHIELYISMILTTI